MTFTTYKTGRPRKAGDRYPSGKLKPTAIAPNKKVVALRRELLGAKPNEYVDIAAAENPLDLALARGWLTWRQHDAACRLRGLYGGIRLPMAKTTADPQRHAPVPSPVTQLFDAMRGDGMESAGVVIGADRELLAAVTKAQAAVDAGRMTPQQYSAALTRAEKDHRRACIDLKRLSDADITAIFDKVMRGGFSTSPPPKPLASATGEADIQPIEVDDELREVWRSVSADMIREMVSFGILHHWPRWIVDKIQGLPVNAGARRRRNLLVRGLDQVADILRLPQSIDEMDAAAIAAHDERRKRNRISRNARLAAGQYTEEEQERIASGEWTPPPTNEEKFRAIVSHSFTPAAAKLIADRTTYVDQTGAKLFEVEQIRRAPRSQ